MEINPASSANQTGEQRYRHLFEHAPICIFVINLNVSPITILEVNKRAELIYGYPAAELVGMRRSPSPLASRQTKQAIC